MLIIQGLTQNFISMPSTFIFFYICYFEQNFYFSHNYFSLYLYFITYYCIHLEPELHIFIFILFLVFPKIIVYIIFMNSLYWFHFEWKDLFQVLIYISPVVSTIIFRKPRSPLETRFQEAGYDVSDFLKCVSMLALPVRTSLSVYLKK